MAKRKEQIFCGRKCVLSNARKAAGCKDWSQSEIDLLKRGYEKGTPVKQIAQKVGHSHKSCISKAIEQGFKHKRYQREPCENCGKLRPKRNTKFCNPQCCGEVRRGLVVNKKEELKRRELYGKGLFDHEIAKECDVRREAIREWRHRRGLPPNCINKITARDEKGRIISSPKVRRMALATPI